MNTEHVRTAQRLEREKRTLRTKAEEKIRIADEKYDSGDFTEAKTELMDARGYIQKALKLVRELGERGTSERTIQDDIEDLWGKIEFKEKIRKTIRSA